MVDTTHSEQGFTILEILVVIVVISILSLVTLASYPTARSNQALRLAEQQIQSSLREAQQRALNELRDTNCITSASLYNGDQRYCSNIGIYLSGSTMTMFADSSDDDGQFSIGSDYEIKQMTLSAGVTVVGGVGTNSSFLFKSLPGITTEFYRDGQGPEAHPGTITLQSGKTVASYSIASYGQVERK